MNETELRALVRAAIARHTGYPAERDRQSTAAAPPRLHASHGIFTLLPAGTDADGPCFIEPAVMCNHCGYCKSFGH